MWYNIQADVPSTSKRTRKKSPTEWLLVNLNAAGFPKRDAKTIFIPDWWDKTCETDEGLLQQLTLKVAGFFRISYQEASGLFAGEQLAFSLPAPPEMKLKATASTGDNLPATLWKLHNLARLLRRGFYGALQPCPFSESMDALSCVKEKALKIRQEILDKSRPYVDFSSLVQYCWEKNIILAASSSATSGRVHGAALQQDEDGRNPVIFLCSKEAAYWQAFRLAHELGHIVLGHGGEMVDTEGSESDSSAQEKEANEFARYLLMGDQEIPTTKLRYGGVTQFYLQTDGRRLRVAQEILALFMAKAQGGDAYGVVNWLYGGKKTCSPMKLVNDLLLEKVRESNFSYEDEECLHAYLCY